MKLKYPSIYEEIKAKVATGQFIPVGGTWVEMVSCLFELVCTVAQCTTIKSCDNINEF